MSEKKIRVATQKMMAYPKHEVYEDSYELHKCLHCKEEYLSQGILDEEVEFCPLHINFAYCIECGETAEKSEMTEVSETEFYCSECFVPRCSECNEPMEKDEGKFCSKQCYNEYMGDIMEDEYKDR